MSSLWAAWGAGTRRMKKSLNEEVNKRPKSTLVMPNSSVNSAAIQGSGAPRTHARTICKPEKFTCLNISPVLVSTTSTFLWYGMGMFCPSACYCVSNKLGMFCCWASNKLVCSVCLPVVVHQTNCVCSVCLPVTVRQTNWVCFLSCLSTTMSPPPLHLPTLVTPYCGGYMAVYTYSYTYILTNLHFKAFNCLPAVSPNSSSTSIYNKNE